MEIDNALNIIDKIHGFDDTSTMVGEAWKIITDELDRLQRNVRMYRATVLNIANNSIACDGPDCPYCEDDEKHPQSWEATMCTKLLEELGEEIKTKNEGNTGNGK